MRERDRKMCGVEKEKIHREMIDHLEEAINCAEKLGVSNEEVEKLKNFRRQFTPQSLNPIEEFVKNGLTKLVGSK